MAPTSRSLVPFSYLPFSCFIPDATTTPPPDLLQSISFIAPFIVSSSSVKDTLSFLPRGSDYYVLDREGNIPIDEAIDFLDQGALKIISSNVELIAQGIPPERFLFYIALKGASSLLTPEIVQLGIEGVLVDQPEIDDILLESIRGVLGGDKDLLILPDSTLSARATVTIIDSISKKRKSPSKPVTVIPVSNLSITEPSDDTISVTKLFISSLKLPEGDLPLFPTIPITPTGLSLGLVYSTPESLAHSISSSSKSAVDGSTLATYYSRSRNSLWTKGLTSGSTQDLLRIRIDCDADALEFRVREKDNAGGFCHVPGQHTCFGSMGGLEELENMMKGRKRSAPEGSYTRRLFEEPGLLNAKILEEANELSQARTKEEVAEECADLFYFAMAKCVTAGVGLEDVAGVLESRKSKVTRRKGDAKKVYADKLGLTSVQAKGVDGGVQTISSAPEIVPENDAPIRPKSYDLDSLSRDERVALLRRPLDSSADMISKVLPILNTVKTGGDAGLRSLISRFDRCSEADNPQFSTVLSAPYDSSLMEIPQDTKSAIDTAYSTIRKFHAAQIEGSSTLKVETFPGVICSRFHRAIERVGLYVPGGTAILPSTALMLAIPAQVAGCKFVSIATPPRPDGTIAPEILYIASICGVNQVVKAGGAQAVGAMGWGTESAKKVDKIFGPGNQWVTAAKMALSMDSAANVAIDMPAGPSEILVIADSSSQPPFVAADLLSQAEHGPDSQVVLVSINLDESTLEAIQTEIDTQARALPRVDIIRKCISNSLIVKTGSLDEAIEFSNQYAPEHLIMHVDQPQDTLPKIWNAGSVFLGPWSPESCGDYASGTNHTLPTAGYARQYSGVSTSSFMKHITSQQLSVDGLSRLGPVVEKLAAVEKLDAHRNAVTIRLNKIRAGEYA